jgi:hypothetical protein
MVAVHREVAGRLGGRPRAVLLDTPYGFQENADEISARAVDYFARRVQLAVEVVGFPGPLAADPAARSPQPGPAALARLREADFVFAGPGSPTYALGAWRASPVPGLLAAKLAQGGAVVFSSAAALTVGRFTLPVYEVYKVGQPAHWLEGLDLAGPAGLAPDCAIVPHFDNAEGGTHDTRYCYMGARRLRGLEDLLPPAGWILGVDEHTALVLDLDAGEAAVLGRGAVTARRRGAEARVPAGSRVPVADLAGLARAGARTPAPASPPRPDGPRDPAPGAAPPLREEVGRLAAAFDQAVAERRAGDAAAAVLALDRAIGAWAADTLQSDEPDRARAVLHALVHRLGEAAAAGLRDPREPLAPLVGELIGLRAELRGAGAFEVADRLRARLAAAGIELRDTPAGTVWVLRDR